MGATYDYNDRGALLSATGPSGASSFSYDAEGRVTSRTDAAGTTGFGYDKGRPRTVTDGVTGVGLTYGYNKAGQLRSVQYGTGQMRTFDYDPLGRRSPTSSRTPAAPRCRH